jgi:hypothetical protein
VRIVLHYGPARFADRNARLVKMLSTATGSRSDPPMKEVAKHEEEPAKLEEAPEPDNVA